MRLILVLISTLAFTTLRAQTVKDLKNTSKSYSSSGTGSSNNSFSRPTDSGAGCLNLITTLIWIGQGMGQLGREEMRLAAKNKEDNHLFCLEIKPQACYGLTGFIRLQPQIRANLGWFSLDLRQSILQDASAEFKTLGFLFWMNIWNKGKFRFRAGAGSLALNTTGESFFQYALGAEFLPSSKIRFELEAGMSESLQAGELRPLREIQFRVYHPFWTKGILQASVFGGAGSQQYFENMNFTTLDAGLNFRLSASKYKAAVTQP